MLASDNGRYMYIENPFVFTFYTKKLKSPEVLAHSHLKGSKPKKKLTGSKIGAIFCKITSRITTQNLKIGPWGLFEKFAFLFLPIIKSGPRKGQNTPKSDFRGQKYPPGCEFNMKHVVLYVGHLFKPFLTKRIWPGWLGGSGKVQILPNIGLVFGFWAL